MNEEIIIKGNDLTKYLELKKQGYKTVWTGENLICLERG